MKLFSKEVGVRIDTWTHLMRECIIELCTLIRKECVKNGKEKSI